MRKVLSIVVVVLAMGLVTSPAVGWEFHLTGTANWTYETYSQMGPDGFFGRYNVDLSGANISSVNGWFGSLGLVSGSKATDTQMSVDMFPTIKINQALGFTGKYRIGSWADNTGASYMVASAPGITNPISEGHWMMWSIYATLPWGGVYYGKRPFTVGCGLQFDGTGNRTTEMLTLSSGYGPFLFGLGFHPWRDAQFDNPQVITPWNNVDDNSKVDRHWMAYVTYFAGPLELGLGNINIAYSRRAELEWNDLLKPAFAGTDTHVNEGWAYMKYNNGRFFLNAEGDWYLRRTTYQGLAPTYIESLRYMTEFGFIAGPAKLSLLYAFLPGPDRRNGALIRNQPVIEEREQGNSTLFSHYSMLLAGLYAGGETGELIPNRNYISDARIFAARLDHAVAANLNVWVSGFLARRVSKGYGWGYIRPNLVAVPALPTDIVPTFIRNAAANSIPDSNLGLEIDAGISWNLLEGWNLSITGGYWQPGEWFKHACITKDFWATWNAPVAGNWWGVYPDRSIDPVFGLTASFSASF